MRIWAVLAVISVATLAHADPRADAGKALQAFVDAAAAKNLPEEVDAFITPGHDAENEIGDLDALATIVAKPTLKILSTHLARSGTAAWIVGEIGGASYVAHIGDKPSTTLRASAFLTLDGGVWHVRAAHWSGEKRDEKLGEGCGMLDSAYGGDLAWVATEVDTDTLCTSYRAFFVLEKEGTARKIVHAHFSGWVMAP
jgi:hypothetical protein